MSSAPAFAGSEELRMLLFDLAYTTSDGGAATRAPPS